MKHWIEKLKEAKMDEVLETLKQESTLLPFEKNFIYTYLFPAPLKHMELVSVIENKRHNNPGVNLLEPDNNEVLILLRAYRTLQYNKFILHLLHSFIENQEGTYIVNEECKDPKCSICGKKLYHYPLWITMADSSHPEYTKREYLMFGNDQTGLVMCLDCMVQLKELNKYLEEIEGNDYLSKRKLWGR